MHSEESVSQSMEGEHRDLAGLGGFGILQFPSTQGNLSSPLPSSLSSSPSPAPPQFTFLSPCCTFFSPSPKLVQSPPSGFKAVRIPGPPPHRPGLGTGSGNSSLLASAQHDLGDKVDDGRGRLVGVKLREEVAGVVRGAALLPGHEAEELRRGTSLCLHPLSFLWIQVTEGDSVEGVVSPEEELSLVVSQCDSLGRDFEMNDGGSRRGVSSQCL